jgi:hypothetical protein
MKNSPVNANKINLLFKKGIDNLHKLDRLVAISKEENSIYLEESKELIALAEQASDYSSDLNRFIISYFETINVTIDDRIIDEELTKVDDRTHADYQNKINEYFKNITPNCSKSMTIVKTYETDVFVLQKLRENNKKVEQFYNEYRTISTNLKNHFNLVKAKLGGDDKIKTKPRANPYNPTTEAKSYAKYEQLRESSLAQLQEIITLLATVFPEEK